MCTYAYFIYRDCFIVTYWLRLSVVFFHARIAIIIIFIIRPSLLSLAPLMWITVCNMLHVAYAPVDQTGSVRSAVFARGLRLQRTLYSISCRAIGAISTTHDNTARRACVRPRYEFIELRRDDWRLLLIWTQSQNRRRLARRPARGAAVLETEVGESERPARERTWSRASSAKKMYTNSEHPWNYSNRAVGSCVYRTTTVIYSLGHELWAPFLQCLGQLSLLPSVGR